MPPDGQVKIAPANSAKATTPAGSSPFTFWDKYYADHDDTPEDLAKKVVLLRMEEDFVDVEAILRGYLKHKPQRAQSWMYQSLAVTMDINGRSPEKIKECLGHAASLAEKSRDVPAMLLVADMLFVRGDRDRVAKLIDNAIATTPYYAIPLMRSLSLAEASTDIERMGRGLESLHALGWPGCDEQVRAEAKGWANKLIKKLRNAKRDDEADKLGELLEQVRGRDVVAYLRWKGDADIDLVITEPDGGRCTMLKPVTLLGGSLVLNGYGKTPEEIYVCPRAFKGDYRFGLDVIYNNPKDLAKEITLEVITGEGTRYERRETFPLAIQGDKLPEPVTVELAEGQRTKALAYKGALADLHRMVEAQLQPTPTAPVAVPAPPDTKAARKP